MEQLSLIENISFESGVKGINELPSPLKEEVIRFNEWTTQAAHLQEENAKTQEKLSLTLYARQAAFNNIQQMAQSLEEKNEAPTPAVSNDVVSDVEVDAPVAGNSDS